MTNEVLSFVYLYAVGGVLFLGSLLLLVRRGALNLKSSEGRGWVTVLVLGYGAYMAFHVVTQFVLPGMGGTP
jgi:hypothetical protein